MKNILFVTQTLAPTGSEVILANILRHGSREKFRFGVFLFYNPGALLEDIPQDVDVFVLQAIRKGTFTRIKTLLLKVTHAFRLFPFLNWIFKPDFFFRLSATIDQRFLYKIFFKKNFDIVYFNCIVFPHLMSFCQKMKIPFVLHTHELAHMFSSIPDSYKTVLLEKPLHVIATSRAAQLVFEDLGRSTEITIWNPGLDFSKIDRASKKFIQSNAHDFHWLGLGYNDLNKNILLFLKVAHRLTNSGYKAKFTWVGLNNDQLYDRWLQAQSMKIGLESVVKLLPKTYNDDTYYGLLASADALMLPSFNESFSLAAVESIYLGKPILTFANGGHAEYLNANNGVLSQNFSEEDFVSKAIWLMENASNFNEQKMRASVMKFDIRTQIISWQIAMESLQ